MRDFVYFRRGRYSDDTCDFPAGLISDYIKMVDKIRKEDIAAKEKKSA